MSSKPGPAAWGGARSHRPVRIRGVLSRHEICLVQGSHPPFKCLRFNELVDCKEEGIGRNHYRSGGSISFHLIPYARVSWCKTEVQNCSGASPKTRSRLQAFEKVFRPSKARTKKTFGARLGGGSFALATPGSGSFFFRSTHGCTATRGQCDSFSAFTFFYRPSVAISVAIRLISTLAPVCASHFGCCSWTMHVPSCTEMCYIVSH